MAITGTTVVGIFDTRSDAQAAADELARSGFERDRISMVSNNVEGETTTSKAGKDTAAGAGKGAVAGAGIGAAAGLVAAMIPGIGPVLAMGPLAAALSGAGIGAATGGIVGGLTKMGVPDEQAGYYAEGIRRGGTLLMIDCPNRMLDMCVEILHKHNVADINERAATWKKEGWSRFEPTATPFQSEHLKTERTRYGKTAVLTPSERAFPVIEEELRVGKREVVRGGVRIFNRIVEKTVEQPVTLHEEKVSVERRPVDRPASGAEWDSFREGVVEVTERGEEAVVAKEARVVEEVVINKEDRARTETVRDTVRRTDVKVENAGTGAMKGSGHDRYASDFRSDFTKRYARKAALL